jgi:hypothetical protein
MADATIPADAAAELVLLEGPTPLRDSHMWALQRSFYEKKGVACWQEAVVPNFVTSNAFLAAAYAKTILAYIRDWYR